MGQQHKQLICAPTPTTTKTNPETPTTNPKTPTKNPQKSNNNNDNKMSLIIHTYYCIWILT